MSLTVCLSELYARRAQKSMPERKFLPLVFLIAGFSIMNKSDDKNLLTATKHTAKINQNFFKKKAKLTKEVCLLYTSDAADE